MATTPPANPQYPAPPPMGTPPPPARKKMGPLGWVLIGCGGLVVLIVVGMLAVSLIFIHKAKQAGLDSDLMKRNPGLASAKFFVAMNPNLETISVDDARGVIHIHDKKQNKNFILSFDDARKGHMTLQEEGREAVTLSATGNGPNGGFEVQSAEGSVKVGGGGPVNLPSWVPSYPNSQPQATMTSEDARGRHAVYSFKTGDPTARVLSFYKDALAAAGLRAANNSMTLTTASGGMIAAADEGKKREVVVVVGTESGETTVTVTYTERK